MRELFQRRLPRQEERALTHRIGALEDYVEYLRQQGEYGFSQAGKRLDALDGGKEGTKDVG